MSGYIEQGRILSNEAFSPDVWYMRIEAPQQAAIAQVGQFCNVRVSDRALPLLRRPISYGKIDSAAGTVDLIYRVVGQGTELMAQMKAGDTIDLLGPLGQPFELSDNMILVGGGVGIAPMLCIADQLKEGQQATVILGFRSKTEAFWADFFKGCPVTVKVTTDDGSMGTKGFPTVVLEDLLTAGGYDSVLTCGPTPMMKGVAKVAADHGVACQVSLEERMGCGTGGCLGCSCGNSAGKRFKVCTDGPVFPAEEVFS